MYKPNGQAAKNPSNSSLGFGRPRPSRVKAVCSSTDKSSQCIRLAITALKDSNQIILNRIPFS